MKTQASVLLNWEWPAGRQPDARIAVRLKSIEPEGGGLFGIKRSPSIVQNLPDATRVHASVLASEPAWKSSEIELVLPKAELPATRPSERIALGIFQGHICICAGAIPSDVGDAALAAWLAQWHCAPK